MKRQQSFRNMFLLLLSFVWNLVFTIGCILCAVLLFFWSLGKYKEWQVSQSPQQVSDSAHIHANPDQNLFPRAMRASNIRVGSEFPQTSVTRNPIPTNAPAVPPRRISFSTNVTPSSKIRKRQSSSGAPGTNRRVTFSLTPEQRQHELDKKATAALKKYHAPMLKTNTHPDDFATTPLVELFPSTPPSKPLILSSPMLSPLPSRPSLLRHSQDYHSDFNSQHQAPPNTHVDNGNRQSLSPAAYSE